MAQNSTIPMVISTVASRAKSAGEKRQEPSPTGMPIAAEMYLVFRLELSALKC
jgi:hypothetical protein